MRVVGLLSFVILVAGCHAKKNTFRLVDGSRPDEGRLEVRVRRKWRSVCENRNKYGNTGFTIRHARYVCEQLGFPSHLARFSKGGFGEGKGNLYFLDCKKTKHLHVKGDGTKVEYVNKIKTCRAKPVMYSADLVENCTQANAISLSCNTPITAAHNSSGKSWKISPEDGSLLVFKNNTWGRIGAAYVDYNYVDVEDFEQAVQKYVTSRVACRTVSMPGSNDSWSLENENQTYAYVDNECEMPQNICVSIESGKCRMKIKHANAFGKEKSKTIVKVVCHVKSKCGSVWKANIHYIGYNPHASLHHYLGRFSYWEYTQLKGQSIKEATKLILCNGFAFKPANIESLASRPEIGYQIGKSAILLPMWYEDLKCAPGALHLDDCDKVPFDDPADVFLEPVNDLDYFYFDKLMLRIKCEGVENLDGTDGGFLYNYYG